MWGAAVHDRSEGVHRPLTATALVFQEDIFCRNRANASGGATHLVHPLYGEKRPKFRHSMRLLVPADKLANNSGSMSTDCPRQVLLAIDHCLFGAEEVRLVLRKVIDGAHLQEASVQLVFSHTHAAGLLNLDRVDLPGGDLIPGYLDSLGDTLSRLTLEAIESVQRVTIEYTTGRCNLAAHRDLYDSTSGQWACGYNPDGPTDDTVLVARVVSEAREPLATIVNYACHPTTLAWDNRLISPDFPGAMREIVERATSVPCVFLQGAAGDLGPMHGYVGDPGVADRNGRQLGYAVLSAWESMGPPCTAYAYAGPVVSGATIGTWHYVPLDPEQAAAASTWHCNAEAISLPLRGDLPDSEHVRQEWSELLRQEQQAANSGNAARARELRALVERHKRMLGRLACLPKNDQYPYQATVWRMGDAVWIAASGEPYNLLQRELRGRFPATPIVIATIANGWGPSYLPTAGTYGKGIYQESIAVLAQGSLEQLIDCLSDRIKELLGRT
jgi:hypothetical protein